MSLKVEQSFSCIGAKSLSIWELVSFPNFMELIRIIRINSVIQSLRQVILYIWLYPQFIHQARKSYFSLSLSLLSLKFSLQTNRSQS